MTRTLIISTIIMLLLVSSISTQAGWHFVVESEGGTRYYHEIEKDRKPPIPAHRLVWEKQVIPFSVDAELKGNIELKEYDCQKRSYQTVELTAYFRNGKTEKTIFNDPFFRSRWFYPAPESVGEALLEAACKDNGPPLSQPARNASPLKTSPPQSSDMWKRVGDDEDGVTWFYRLKKADSLFRQVWVSALAKSRPTSKSEVAYDQDLWEVDCGEGKYRFLQTTDFSRDGKVIFQKSFTNDKWTYVLPESMGADILKAACK
ncbi:MAG: hypothetical protein QOD75_814 [Blastocatellia bacterium]|jgi:hypothetical protein|nr:hypothetical protein [Blastocatellia bacterium]